MRGTFFTLLRRSVLRGALLATAGFVVSVALGAGGFWIAGTSAVAVAESISRMLPETPAELRPSPSVVSRTEEGVSVVLVNEVAIELGRLEAAAAIEAEETATAALIAAPTPPATVPLAPGDRVPATISFYYCERGTQGLHGDGGGFCGVMRDGTVVYDGAAACDRAYLGQQFRIEGDPLARVYRCADTGGAVHGQHRDVWFQNSDDGWDWIRAVGQRAVIEILP